MKRMLIFLLVLMLLPAWALTEKAWVLCQPDSYVICRYWPKKSDEIAGFLYCGDPVETTGKTKNGYAQIYCDFETCEGWVYAGYLVYDEPYEVNERRVITSIARVRARRTINGKLRRWLYNGDTITVYWESAKWAVTSQGYIKTELTGDYDP